MNKSPVRVRFAPSPTGIMHLGNVRTALLNYLYAFQKKGTCILRIEDTDPERNFDPSGLQLMQDLKWLGLAYQEGPQEGGNYGPYLQSERNAIYQEKLDLLKDKNIIYRCFCSSEELEKKRQRMIALKLPPRYDRACLEISQKIIENNLAKGTAFIWRFKVDQSKNIHITDIARGSVSFDLNNFSDFPLNRADGSFTFIFANCIDDIEMRITHVIRGEDHLTNTANQVVLFHAFNVQVPTFWHLPILCNTDGKKLSKRDFGFSLHDLQKEGFLPEAITNYLGIIGASFPQEVMNLEELSLAMRFDHINPTGTIKYDVEKLRWINHKWINRYDLTLLTDRIIPFIENHYPAAIHMERNLLIQLIKIIRTELVTLLDSVPALLFYFQAPTITAETLQEHIASELHKPLFNIIIDNLDELNNPELFMKRIKQDAQDAQIPLKALYAILRLGLTGSSKGPSLVELLTILGPEESLKRLKKLLHK